jgi:hypothetical protein
LPLTRLRERTSTVRRGFLTKKKKPGKQSSPISLSQEEQLSLSMLLRHLGTTAPEALVDRILSPALAEGLVEKLPLHNPGTPDLVAAIGKAFPQKSVQKAVRKKLFKLGQVGIPVAVQETTKEPAVSTPVEEPEAYIGPIDGTGSRPFLIAIPQRLSGVDLAMGVVSDEKGIIEFLYGRYSRKKMKELKEVLFSKIPYMVETNLSHVVTVLEHAYRVEGQNPGNCSGEYLRFRPSLLKNAEPLARPAVTEFIPLSSIHPGVLTETQVQRLLSHELTASWTMDPEKLHTLTQEIHRAEESPIFISEAQRREHIFRIKEEGIPKIFGEKDSETLRTRLQETAYVFFRIGQETFARLCLAAALSLDAKDPLLKVNPLLKALLDRSLAQLPKTLRPSPLILR